MATGESALDVVANSAREWVFRAEEGIGPAIAGYPGDELAKDLLLRLRVIAFPEFHASLTLVTHPYEAIAVDVLLRSLLEALAHAAWIVQGEARGRTTPKDACVGSNADGISIERRAHCLEFGMAKQYAQSVRAADPSSMDPSTPANAQIWLDQAQAGHVAAGCTGRGRGFADVQRTLVEFGARMKLGAWPVDLWRVTSGVAHHLLPHRVAQQVNGDIVWGAPLSEAERLKMLDRLVKVFAHFYQYVVVVLDESLLRPFQEDSRRIMEELQGAFSAVSDSPS